MSPRVRPNDDQSASTAADSYAEARERSLLRLVFDATAKNASFVLDDALLETAKTHPKRDLALLYNAMAACGLNSTESWRLLLSGARSTATCVVCRGPVLQWRENDRVDGSAGGRETEDRFGYYATFKSGDVSWGSLQGGCSGPGAVNFGISL